MQLIDQKAAAKILSVSVRTMEQWRQKGGGPPFVKLGGKLIRYSTEELEAWVQSQTREPEPPAPPVSREPRFAIPKARTGRHHRLGGHVTKAERRRLEEDVLKEPGPPA